VKVLHCIYDDPGNPWVAGGGSLRVREIYRRLTGEVDATVATGAYPGARDELRAGVSYRHLGVPRPYLLSRASYAASANRLLRRSEYDAAVFDFSGYTPLVIPRDRPVGIVVHMLHGPTASGRWGRVGGALLAAAERGLLRRARVICVTSDWIGREVAAIAPGARLILARSGIPETFFRVQRAESGYLLFYGRFDIFHKGIDTLLAAFDVIAAARPEVELRIAGRGRDEAPVRELVHRSPHAARIRVHADPSEEEVARLFSGALAFLMPSRLEGLPMAPVEAMAAGVPVVASRVGALDEVLLPPAGGILVPPDDAAALAGAVGTLLDDAVLRASTSLSARKAASRFRWEQVVGDHRTFLELVASS
jgi:glycosyltransferase involved in cell wall biosynthesis